MKIRAILGFIAAVIVLGCGGANVPYVPSGGGTGGGGGVSNFSLTGGSTQTVAPGGTAVFDVFVGTGQTGGLARSPLAVTLSAVGLPANASASFSLNPVTPTNPETRSVLSVGTTGVAQGNYPFTVRGTDGVNTRTIACTLVVSNEAPAFTVFIESLDPQMVASGNDDTANFRVSVAAPSGYQGNARLEYRFVEAGAPTQDDVIAVWHRGVEQSANTIEYTIGAANENDSAECTFSRQRNLNLLGTYRVEFKVVPLAGGFAPATGEALLEIRSTDARPRKD